MQVVFLGDLVYNISIIVIMANCVFMYFCKNRLYRKEDADLSENNRTPDADNEASVKRPASPAKPDISFKPNTADRPAQPQRNGSTATQQRQTAHKRQTNSAPQKPIAGQKPIRRAPQTNKASQGAAAPKPTVKRPTQNAMPSGGANGTLKRKQPNGQPTLARKKPPVSDIKTANAVKRPPVSGNKPANAVNRSPVSAGKPPSNGRNPQRKPAADPKKQRNANASAKTKKGFTKKQAMTIAGLILILMLVLVLVVGLILIHYFGLFNRDHVDHTTSEAITYSDVDFSRPDTIDKSAEDEKLKELSAQGTKISNKDVMNILLIAEDLRDTAEESAGNTDVLMLISINTKDKTITLTSIMRDCYVAFADENNYWWSTRINAAYWYGGVKLTRQTIENYLNVKIDRYVLVNFNVFIDIVDALGGLDLYVSDEEANGYPGADPYGDNTRGMQNPLDEQNKYLHNKKGTDYIKKGGDLHLNGNQVLAYARLRHVGNSDYERTERQRRVITEMIKKSRGMDLVEMDRLANKIFPQIKTDVTTTEMMGLLVDMLDYRNYSLQEFRVPADETYANTIIGGMDVLSVDFEANAQMFKELVYGTIKLEDDGTETDQIIE